MKIERVVLGDGWADMSEHYIALTKQDKPSFHRALRNHKKVNFMKIRLVAEIIKEKKS